MQLNMHSDKAPLTKGRFLQGGEVAEPLENGLFILQKEKAHRFGMESVALASFAQGYSMRGKVADFGTGTGILPLLLCARGSKASFTAVEIDCAMADMAHRSVLLNGLEQQIAIVQGDLRDLKARIPANSLDCILCNPPFFGSEAPLRPDSAQKDTAKHADDGLLQHICETAKCLLKDGGRIALVYSAPKFLNLADALRENRLAPKRICPINRKLLLVDAVKNGGDGLIWINYNTFSLDSESKKGG